MKSTFFTIILISSVTVLSINSAMAVHELFNEMDANRDGKVSIEEFARDMEKNSFNKLDKNEDGFITLEEWGELDFIEEKEKAQDVFKAIDKNANKRISYPDFSNYVEKYSNIEEAFMILDKNKDGSLSPDEITLRPLFRLITIRY